MPSIQDIARSTGFRGSTSRRVAEPRQVSNLPVIDNSDPTESKGGMVSTSIDCYVAGTYLGKKGQRMEVVQRYQIFVRYSGSTQLATMEQIRSRITQDYAEKYGQMNITTVYVPELIAPIKAPKFKEPEAMEFYRGSEEWRTRIQRAAYDIGTEKEKADRNIGNIRRKYGI
ncbi:hypothetical protein GOV11_00920 [Candidatus Woesearchaeota archaeon]|nr:hypothetical protein [Candidatus Woesearchaeota archaeon]